MLLRRTFLFLSQCKNLERLFRDNQIGSRTRARFIAGETRREALDATCRLNREGFRVTLDYLGEEVVALEQAEKTVTEYAGLIENIAGENLDAGLSVKLSHLGVRIDREQAFEHLLRVLQTARKHNQFVRVDMEGSELCEITLELVRRAHEKYDNVGTVIQACMRSASEEVDRLTREGISVRLVKGAYMENAETAFQENEEVILSFMRLAETLLREGRRPAIATHDEHLIEFACDMAFIFDLTENELEFQMLYGIRRDLQKILLDKGYRVRVYLPYGKAWYGYFMRRLAERPGNLLFLLRHLRE